MSTDAHRNGPADHSAETGEQVATPAQVEPEHAGEPPVAPPVNEPTANEPTIREPAADDPAGPVETTETGTTPDQPADPTSPDDGPGVAYPTSPAPTPAPEETHVAQSTQHRDDPFAEVDGGEPDHTATTAFPTAEEDDAIRDERARRFGRPRSGDELDSDPGSKTQAVPATAGEEPTSRVPLAAAGAGAVATVGATGGTQTMPATTAPAEEDPFKDFDDGPASRAAAHWWSILISIVLVPVSWYLITDGGERMNFNLTNGGPFNWAGPLELAGGLLCLFFVLLAARWSSVGAILVGTVTALLGIAFIVFNTEAMDLVTEYQGTLVQALEQLGQNIVDHLLVDARSGRLAVYGVALVMVGVVSHGARRQGRREERRKAAIGA